MLTSSKRAYAIPRSAAPRALAVATADLYLHRRLSDTVWFSLCGLGVWFLPFPGQSSSGNQVLGEGTVPGGPSILITSLVPTTRFPM